MFLTDYFDVDTPYGSCIVQDHLAVANYQDSLVTLLPLLGATRSYNESVLLKKEHKLFTPTSLVCTPDRRLMVAEYMSGMIKVCWNIYIYYLIKFTFSLFF